MIDGEKFVYGVAFVHMLFSLIFGTIGIFR